MRESKKTRFVTQPARPVIGNHLSFLEVKPPVSVEVCDVDSIDSSPFLFDGSGSKRKVASDAKRSDSRRSRSLPAVNVDEVDNFSPSSVTPPQLKPPSASMSPILDDSPKVLCPRSPRSPGQKSPTSLSSSGQARKRLFWDDSNVSEQASLTVNYHQQESRDELSPFIPYDNEERSDGASIILTSDASSFSNDGHVPKADSVDNDLASLFTQEELGLGESPENIAQSVSGFREVRESIESRQLNLSKSALKLSLKNALLLDNDKIIAGADSDDVYLPSSGKFYEFYYKNNESYYDIPSKSVRGTFVVETTAKNKFFVILRKDFSGKSIAYLEESLNKWVKKSYPNFIASDAAKNGMKCFICLPCDRETFNRIGESFPRELPVNVMFLVEDKIYGINQLPGRSPLKQKILQNTSSVEVYVDKMNRILENFKLQIEEDILFFKRNLSQFSALDFISLKMVLSKAIEELQRLTISPLRNIKTEEASELIKRIQAIVVLWCENLNELNERKDQYVGIKTEQKKHIELYKKIKNKIKREECKALVLDDKDFSQMLEFVALSLIKKAPAHVIFLRKNIIDEFMRQWNERAARIQQRTTRLETRVLFPRLTQ